MRTASAYVTAIPLGRRLPGASSNLPGRQDLDRSRGPPRLHAKGPAPPLFGLAPGGVCRAAGVAAGAVRSYRTVSPLPRQTRNAPRRSVLCGTIPGLAPAGCYPAPLIHGARTFLPGILSVRPERPSGRLTGTGMGALATAVKGSDGGEVKGQRAASRCARAPRWFSSCRDGPEDRARCCGSMDRQCRRRVQAGNAAEMR
jgi:hypothetical protein